MTAINSEYKDTLFSFIFGHESHKEWTLSLYNAVNGSNYADADSIEITTIKQVLYLGMHNDVSFLIENVMSLYEQQSSWNPNCPLRMLQYTGNLYEQYLKRNKLNKYGTKLLTLPVPKLVVFYIGKTDIEDEVILKLSDSFPAGANSDIEVRVRMLNINPGKNTALMDMCQALKEYSWLIGQIRTNRASMTLEEAVDKAIRDMPEDFILRSFLIEHQAEVKGMLLTEYNEVEQMELFKEEGRKEGEDLLGKLVSILLSKGMVTEASRAAADSNARQQLYKEYGLI